MASQKKLSDRFLIGEELGRGAYGQVYKGIDYVSGDTVAIKQISLAGIPSDNLQSVMGEIDLLKTLNHKNIVKYIGSFKTRQHLYIILEYMENGSLASIIKPSKFGVFPESLVSVYIAQVLQGLHYLHEQGVVHRDIKGANILTTKDGLVKLADFGVATKLGEPEDRREDAANPTNPMVVGTPYWMAPEVIEMTQVTSSSDIWSVGCLIIELLTGYPPYFELNSMSAMFRIVQDPLPPLPEDISPLLRDFLCRCFLKDAKLRPDAATLLQHEWLQHNRRTLRMSWRRDQGQYIRTLVTSRNPAKPLTEAHETINSVVARMMAAADDEDASARGGPGGEAGATAGQQPVGPLGAGAAASIPDARYREAPSAIGVAAGADGGSGVTAGRAPSAAAISEEAEETALLAACPPPSTAAQYSAQATAASAAASTLPYVPAEAAVSVASPRGDRGASESGAAAAKQQMQMHPAHDGLPSAKSLTSPVTDGSPGQEARQGGYSTPGARPPLPPPYPGLQRSSLAAPPAPLMGLIQRLQGDDSLLVQQQQQQQHQRLMAADAVAGPGSAHGRPVPRDLAAWTEGGGQAYDTLRASSRRMGGLHGGFPGDPGALFDGCMSMGPPEESLGSSLTTQATELRRTVRELVRNMRPTARMDGREAGGRDLGGNRDTPTRAANSLEQLISGGATVSAGAGWAEAGTGSVSGPQFSAAEVKALFLGEGGVLVLMELLDTDNQKAVEAALDLLSALVRDDVRLLESLCLVGMVPAVARFTQQPWQASLRLKAASFVHTLCFQRDSTLQLFIAAGGLKQLCWMVADSVASEPSPLSFVAVQCLLQVLQCYATLPLNYICRILAQCGLVPRLYKLLKETIVKRRQMAPYAAAAAAAPAPAPAASAVAARPAGPAPGPQSPPPVPLSPSKVVPTQGSVVANGGGHYGGHYHARSVSSAAVFPSTSPERPSANNNSFIHITPRSGATIDGMVGPPVANGAPAGPGAGGGGGGPLAHPGVIRAMTLPAGSMAAAVEGRGNGASNNVPGPSLSYEQVLYLLDKTVYMLVVLSNADGAVKSAICVHDNLLQHLDCLLKLQPPHLVEMLRCLRNLTSDPGVMTAIKDAGAISCLVPMLGYPAAGAAGTGGVTAAAPVVSGSAGSTGAGGAAGQAAPNPLSTAVVVPKSEVQMEALNVLYNLCMYDKKAHVEAAAASGIVSHLCSFAAQGWAAISSVRQQRQASLNAPSAPPAGAAGAQTPQPGSATGLQAAGSADPQEMTPGSPAAIAAAAAQWPTIRGFVVPLLIAMVTCSGATRSKLHSSHGLEIFLQLLSDEDSRSVLGVLQALDSWLAEDHNRVEARLTQRDAVAHMVQLYARSCAAQDMQSKLEALRTMLGRSSKLAVSLAMGGLVPWLLAMIQHAAPINRVKILDIVRILYEHYPRPKEFIMMYKIQDVLALLLKTHGRDADAVIQQAQRLLSAFDINVLL